MIRKGNVRNAEAGRCFGKQKKKWKKKKKKEKRKRNKTGSCFSGFWAYLIIAPSFITNYGNGISVLLFYSSICT